MNRPKSTHLDQVLQHFTGLLGPDAVAKRLCMMAEVVLQLALLDLEPARAVLAPCYSGRRGGRPPRDPVAMLRCFVLMAMLGYTSFNKWAAQLRGRPELCVLSGFGPSDPPGLGTLYGFQERLLDGPYRRPCPHVARPSRRSRGRRGRFARNLKAEKQQAKERSQAALAHEHQGRVEAAVAAALKAPKDQLRGDFQGRIQELLMRCGVVPSAQRGLLGELARLVVAGDGSPLVSGANAFGKAVCNCREQGVTECACPRSYTDPTATWGWDSHRKRYFFGHRLHVLVARAASLDLPLHLAITAAHEPDVVTGVEALCDTHRLLAQHLPGACMAYGIFDAGYDATAFYRMVMALGATPLIPLAQKAATPQDARGHQRDADGTPLCPGGARMWRHGYNKRTGKLVHGCPAKRPGRRGGKQTIVRDLSRCPRGRFCEPDSTMGPLLQLAVRDDPRLNPPIARESEEYRRRFNDRTGTERFFSLSKVAGGLDRRPWRRDHLYLTGALCCALAAHARAWVQQQFGAARPNDLDGLLNALRALAAAPLATAA